MNGIGPWNSIGSSTLSSGEIIFLIIFVWILAEIFRDIINNNSINPGLHWTKERVIHILSEVKEIVHFQYISSPIVCINCNCAIYHFNLFKRLAIFMEWCNITCRTFNIIQDMDMLPSTQCIGVRINSESTSSKDFFFYELYAFLFGFRISIY